MESEQLKIFDEDRNQIGVATREEVHRMGYWHEAFHCWFVSKEKNRDYLYLQLRSQSKKDYPGLLDITAAGHLLAYETVLDGVREIKEEIGINVLYKDLVPLGVIDYCVTKKNFIDKELANVFLYKSNYKFDDFTLQEEEVSGIVKVELNDFIELWFGNKETIKIQGYTTKNEEKFWIEEMVEIDKFVPHPILYYKNVVKMIKEKIS